MPKTPKTPETPKDNVVTFRGVEHSKPLELQPVPDVIAAMERYLQMAKDGKIRAIGLGWANEKGTANFAWYPPQSPLHESFALSIAVGMLDYGMKDALLCGTEAVPADDLVDDQEKEPENERDGQGE